MQFDFQVIPNVCITWKCLFWSLGVFYIYIYKYKYIHIRLQERLSGGSFTLRVSKSSNLYDFAVFVFHHLFWCICIIFYKQGQEKFGFIKSCMKYYCWCYNVYIYCVWSDRWFCRVLRSSLCSYIHRKQTNKYLKIIRTFSSTRESSPKLQHTSLKCYPYATRVASRCQYKCTGFMFSICTIWK